MKLQCLTLQAFGPFPNQERIDFLKLGENPLFLIDGPTGAGKSSILHGICYALYGETTDSDRKSVGLRCDHAGDNTMTEVSLDFSIRNNKYRISRVPLQMRPAKRGGGVVEQKPTAHLCRLMDDGSEKTIVAKKISEADDEIEKIIGLTSAQFLQVMVLPQGKFRELLLAKSDERQIILSKLFHTEIYKRIEQILKDKAGSIEQQNRVFEEKKADALFDVNVENMADLELAIRSAEQELANHQKSKDDALTQQQNSYTQLDAAKSLGKLFQSLENKQHQLADTYSNKDEIDAIREGIKRTEKALSIISEWKEIQANQASIDAKNEEVIEINSRCEAADLRVTHASKKVEESKIAYRQRDQLKAKEKEIEILQQKLIELEPLRIDAMNADNNYQTALIEKERLESQIADADVQINQYAVDIETLTDEINAKAQIVEEKNTAKTDYEHRSQLERKRVELRKFTKEYEVAKQKYEVENQSYIAAERNANQIEMIWFNSQAAVLAAKLEVNQPCVVCGSLSHPDPATFVSGSESVTIDDVESARRDEAQNQEKMISAKNSVSESLRSVNDKQAEITQLENYLGKNASKKLLEVENIYRKLKSLLDVICQKEELLSTVKIRKKQIEKERSPISTLLKELEKTLPELSAQKAAADSRLASANKDFSEKYLNAERIEKELVNVRDDIQHLETRQERTSSELTKALTHQSAMGSRLKQLSSDVEKLLKRKSTLMSAWEQVLVDCGFATQQEFEKAHLLEKTLNDQRQEVQQYDQRVQALHIEIDILNKQLEGKHPPVLADLERMLVERSNVLKIVEEKLLLVQQHKVKLEEAQKKIINLETQQNRIKKQYDVVGALSKAASGRGNVRVSLERFVLGTILDSVLTIASQRLYTMSKGKYQIVRQDEDDQKRNTTAGLDLAVHDAYTGKTRPVATLSGGESFMASLALALALSDVVQERSGGIQLDTLFIDEGFGSLDQESLQLAIHVLIDLQSTGRTIGLISHVSELKEQMALRIDVTGSRNGSAISVVT